MPCKQSLNSVQANTRLLDQIAADIVANNVCPDLAKQATNLVMGDGNPNAAIVIIGEAPGRQEDITGLPFMGASGRVLAELLASINMTRHDVYITNIVKYRPPNNRDPKSSEKQAFLPYLERQIAVIAPQLIVTLGRHSMDALLPGMAIGQVHGTVIMLDGRRYLPVYHPAATMYNRQLRQALFDDFAKIPAIISNETY